MEDDSPIIEHDGNFALSYPSRDPLDVQPDPALPLRAETASFFHNERTYIFDRPLAFRTNGWGNDLGV